MAYSIFRVIGQVINKRTKQGVLGLRVEAWDKDQKYHDLLGVGITGREGHFMITFDQTYFRELAPEKFPDLFFRVFHGQKLLMSTEDSVIWNAKKATEVIIDIEMPTPAPAGKDRVSARQVLKTVDFVQRSDFRGLLRETKDKTGATFGFLADMVTNTISKMDIKPIRPGEHRTRDVINQDVTTAKKNLKAQRIKVNEVRPYQPGLNKKSIANLKTFPLALQPGQKVNLYEENGKVRYYSVVKEDETAELKAKMENQLDTILKESKKKDEQISKLERHLNEQRTQQDEIIKMLKPETIEQIEKDVSELKSDIEKIQKKLPKIRTTTKRTTKTKTTKNDKT